MARFLHIADGRAASRIARQGIAPTKVGRGERAVFCVPVVPDANLTFQWARELRRKGLRATAAVFFELPDDEPVLIGRYHTRHESLTAAQAHARYRTMPNAGLEVLVAHRIHPSDIRKIVAAPRLTGWRYWPESKGSPPLPPYRGIYRAAKYRRDYLAAMERQWRSMPEDDEAQPAK